MSSFWQGALSKDVYMYYVKELSLPALIACGAVGILSQVRKVARLPVLAAKSTRESTSIRPN